MPPYTGYLHLLQDKLKALGMAHRHTESVVVSDAGDFYMRMT